MGPSSLFIVKSSRTFVSSSHLEPPEPAHRELSVEVPHSGQLPRVAEVHVLVAAVEAAEAGQGGGLGRAHVVVDPHPPARVEAAHRPRQLLHQVQVARRALKRIPIIAGAAYSWHYVQ